jgi:hypothetical protein
MPHKVPFFDVGTASLNRHGEELCGDQVKVHRTADKTVVVLSDGLGSGVKANILARLTAEIVVTMFREEAPLQDVIETVAGTLPLCQVRRIAYATFIIVEIQHHTGNFKVINFDSPPAFLLKRGRLSPLKQRTEVIQGKTLGISEGTLERGDLLGLISDGVLYAGMGVTMNFGWGWDGIGAFLERVYHMEAYAADVIVRAVLRKTNDLYNAQPGDDATFVAIAVRQPNRLVVLTGPPTDKAKDKAIVDRFLNFDGRKVICGGTTGNIVARQLGKSIESDMATLRFDLPPIGLLEEVDLVTEGVLTLSTSLHLLKECKGELRSLPDDRNGAVLLSRELLRSDSILFLAGEKVNPFYQNPLLPHSVSIRRSLLNQLVDILVGYHKDVKIEWL